MRKRTNGFGNPNYYRHRLHRDEIAAMVEYPTDVQRPTDRSDCWDEEKNEPIGPRPCPFALCRYNNFQNVNASGTIEYAEMNSDITEQKPEDSCALDVANRGPHDLLSVSAILKRTRQRTQQIEAVALEKFRIGLIKLRKEIGQ